MGVADKIDIIERNIKTAEEQIKKSYGRTMSEIGESLDILKHYVQAIGTVECETWSMHDRDKAEDALKKVADFVTAVRSYGRF